MWQLYSFWDLLRFGHSHVLLARLNKLHAINWRAELHLSVAERVNLGESHSERITACGGVGGGGQWRRLLLTATRTEDGLPNSHHQPVGNWLRFNCNYRTKVDHGEPGTTGTPPGRLGRLRACNCVVIMRSSGGSWVRCMLATHLAHMLAPPMSRICFYFS